jgi:uncharacterized cupin superfamily protein
MLVDVFPLGISPDRAAEISLEPSDTFTNIDGTPLQTKSKALWSSTDGTINAGIWECDAGRFWADFGEYGEIVVIVSGELACAGDNGSHSILKPGDSMIFPRGWTGEWAMESPVRKIFASWNAW